jgi:hypothetical protein
MFSTAALAGIKGLIQFNNYLLHISQQLWWSKRNASIFTGEKHKMYCLKVFGLEDYTVPLTAYFYGQLLSGGNFTRLPPPSYFPPVNITITHPNESIFEVLNRSVGYTFQVIFSLWTFVNAGLALYFIIAKGRLYQLRKAHPHSKNVKPPTLALLALSLELIANLWRFTFVVVGKQKKKKRKEKKCTKNSCFFFPNFLRSQIRSPAILCIPTRI